MAIVKMEKLSVVGLESQKEKILKLLMKEGFVQIDDTAFLTEDETIGSFLKKDSEQSQVLEYDQQLYKISQALEIISRNVKIKKSMLAPKPEYEMLANSKILELNQKVEEILQLDKDVSSLKNEQNSLKNAVSLLQPWIKLDIPLEKLSTKVCKVILGTVPSSVEVGEIRQKIEDSGLYALADKIDEDKNFKYLYLISHKESFEAMLEAIKEFNFIPVSFPEETKTVSESIKLHEIKISTTEDKMKKTLDKIKTFADDVSALENLYDTYTVMRDEKQEVSKLVKSKTAFCFTGWVPSKHAQQLKEELTEKFHCFVETQLATRQEGFPVLLENNSFVTPFEAVTNMYSCPSPKDVDPSAIMSFFYIIFFGMMLADAGYGLLVTLACAFYVYKKKLKKDEGKLIKMMMVCGISTIVWGLIFGSVFGASTPALLSPLDDVMLLMAISLLFGIVHIYVGLGIKGYTLLRDKDYISFFSDIVLWYLLVTGVCLLVIPIVAGDIGVFSEIGKYIAIIGAVGIILMGGRENKNIFMRLFKGVTSLYDITGYFGDILSYSRLLALCLSSGVIGQVINLLGAMAGPIGFVIIGLIGHAVNLFIGALGAYVHTSRLQYVEFFGKFYEGGGVPFSPFKLKTKYTNIN